MKPKTKKILILSVIGVTVAVAGFFIYRAVRPKDGQSTDLISGLRPRS